MVSSSRSRVLSTTVVLSFLLGGCTFDEVSLQGLECPCAEGWVCRDEVCVRAEEAVDGGTGAPDLGEPDAAVADAGTDDPGPEDAGLEDLGPEDMFVDGGIFVPIAEGDGFLVDFGGAATPDWGYIMSNGLVGPLTTTGGAASSVTVAASGFAGENLDGVRTNTFGYPESAASDSTWLGSFDSHEIALTRTGTVVVGGLPPGNYRVRLYGSRLEDDFGQGRLARYTVSGTAQDLEIGDNSDRRVEFLAEPDGSGDLVITVGVSPLGSARFAYLGVLELVRMP